jgi:hypothetical protein
MCSMVCGSVGWHAYLKAVVVIPTLVRPVFFFFVFERDEGDDDWQIAQGVCVDSYFFTLFFCSSC